MRSSRGRALILCLDKSGSMSGRPFEALKQGSIMVGKSVFELNEFETFATCFYDDSVMFTQHKNGADYDALINK